MVDVIDHGRQGGRLAGSGRPGDQDETPHLLGQAGDDLRQPQLADGCRAGPHATHGQRHRGSLVVRVDAESPRARQAVGEVDLVMPVEGLENRRLHDGLRQLQRLLRGERRFVVEGAQRSRHPQPRRCAGLDVEVRTIEFGEHHENSIEVRFVHGTHCTGTRVRLARISGPTHRLPDAGAISERPAPDGKGDRRSGGGATCRRRPAFHSPTSSRPTSTAWPSTASDPSPGRQRAWTTPCRRRLSPSPPMRLVPGSEFRRPSSSDHRCGCRSCRSRSP